MVIWSRTQSPAVFSPNLRAYPSGLEVWTFQSCVLARIEPFQGGDFFFRFYLYISRTDKLMRCPFKPSLWHQPRTGLMGCAGVGGRGEGPSCLGQARHCPAVWGLQGAEPREDPNAPVVWHAPQVVCRRKEELVTPAAPVGRTHRVVLPEVPSSSCHSLLPSLTPVTLVPPQLQE